MHKYAPRTKQVLSATLALMVVFGSATVARLSHDRTGFALAMSGFGGVCATAAPPPPRPPPGGPPWRPPRPACCPWATATVSAATETATRTVLFARVIV